MADEPIRAFRVFGLPVDPEPGFAAALYDELAAELGFAVRPLPAPVPLRVRRPRWAARLGLGETAWRLAYLAAVVGLLVILGVAAMVAGSLITRPDPAELAPAPADVVASPTELAPDPAQLVERSRAVYLNPPAFTMTIKDPQGALQQLAADGAGTWRVDRSDQPPGSYQLYDGVRLGSYSSEMETWGVALAADFGGALWPLQGEFAWSRMVPGSDPVAFETVPCAQATWAGREEVAARPVDHVRCADSDIDYWLDTGTGLVLRMRAGPTAPGWEGPMSGLVPVIEATMFATGPADPVTFAWEGPEGAYPASDPPVSTLLKLGEVAPTLAGTTVDGKPFTTAPGRPTAVLFTARGFGYTTREAFDTAASGVTGVRSVVVQENPPGTVAGYLAGHPTPAAVVADPERALGQAWRVNFSMATVLLDDQGRVVALGKQRMSEADVRAQLEALRDGAPIPAPQPPPEVTPYPEPSERIEGSSGGLGRWDAPEPWSAPLLGGGTVAGKDLAGRPAFLWFWSPESELSTANLLQFVQLAKAYGDRASFTVIAMGESTPGWITDTVRRLGVSVPVAFDWDGRVDQAFRIGTESTYLLDARGTVADTIDGVPGEAAAGRMLDALP
jgi:hypothetical protein